MKLVQQIKFFYIVFLLKILGRNSPASGEIIRVIKIFKFIKQSGEYTNDQNQIRIL